MSRALALPLPRPRRQIWSIGGGKGGIGKSLLAASLGWHLARLGKRVVLVDADLGGANLHTCLGLPGPSRTLGDFIQRRVERIELHGLTGTAAEHVRASLDKLIGDLTGLLAVESNRDRIRFLRQQIARWTTKVTQKSAGCRQASDSCGEHSGYTPSDQCEEAETGTITLIGNDADDISAGGRCHDPGNGPPHERSQESCGAGWRGRKDPRTQAEQRENNLECKGNCDAADYSKCVVFSRIRSHDHLLYRKSFVNLSLRAGAASVSLRLTPSRRLAWLRPARRLASEVHPTATQ